MSNLVGNYDLKNNQLLEVLLDPIPDREGLDDYDGYIYGAVVYNMIHCVHCGNTEHKLVDSCWGFATDTLNVMLEQFNVELLDAEEHKELLDK